MDDENQRRIQAFIATKWKQGQCPVCGVNSWQVAVEMGEMPMSRSAGMAYPLFPIFCTNCGYTLLFNAGIAGLLPGTETAEPPPAGSSKVES